MSYLAKLLMIYRERARLEALDGYITSGTYNCLREISGLIISDGARRSQGHWA